MRTASIALASTHVRSAAMLGMTLLALAVPGIASAAQRYAGPGGAGTACTQATPCGFQEAVNNAAAFDEVIVLPGDHGTPALPVPAPASNAAIAIHGQDAAARPRVFVGGPFGLGLNNANASIRDVELVQAPGSAWGLNLNGGATAERVVISGSQCFSDGTATFLDTFCPGLFAPAGTGGAIVLRNVTTIGLGTVPGLTANAGGGTLTVNATNVIARSANGAFDVSSTANPGATAIVSLDHSNFATRSAPGQGGGTTSIADPATNANQTAMPLLVSGTDAHELRGSPTIDAGAARAPGDLDVDRDPRTLGAAPDIGADEFFDRTPVVTTGAASAIGASSVTLNAAVDPRGLATTARFDYGTTSAYGLQTAPVAFGALTGGQPLTTALTGLAPSTTYHFRAIASNSFASRVGSDAKFTTAAAAVSPPGAAPKLTLASKTVNVSVKTGKGGLKATCTAPAGQSCVFKGTLYGPGTLPATKAAAAKTRAKKIGAVTGIIAAGKQGRLRVKVTTSARKQLKRSHRLKARLRGTVSDTAGKHTSLRATLTLKAKQETA